VAYTRCRRLIGGILVFFARWKTPQVSLRLREVSGLPGLVHPRARFCIFVNGLVKLRLDRTGHLSRCATLILAATNWHSTRLDYYERGGTRWLRFQEKRGEGTRGTGALKA
jgi:hypothetical protein